MILNCHLMHGIVYVGFSLCCAERILPAEHEIVPFSMDSPAHGRDLLVIACWYIYGI